MSILSEKNKVKNVKTIEIKPCFFFFLPMINQAMGPGGFHQDLLIALAEALTQLADAPVESRCANDTEKVGSHTKD